MGMLDAENANKSSSSSGGGLNSAGNRASGAGPGASSNRNTSSGGGGLSSSSSTGSDRSDRASTSSVGSDRREIDRSLSERSERSAGLNTSGNRASGAGPGASANRNTTGGGFRGSDRGSTLGGTSLGGGMVSDAARRADLAQAARASENASMSTYDAARALSQNNAARADLAQQARAAETQSMMGLAREQALGTISTAEVGLKDPYNTLSGGLVADVTNMTVRDAITFAKTSWDGKLSNVLGAFQVKDTTLAAVATKMGLMDVKMTPAVQDQIAVGLMQQRANKATVNGQIDVDKFAHELAKEWASLATKTGQSYYSANGIDKASVPYSKVRDIAESLIANGVVSPGKSVGSITSKDVSSVQTQAPGVSRFSSTYMGRKTATAQQNDPSGLPPGTYRGYDPSGLPAETPASGPIPTGRPAQPRSLGQKVVAGVIDAGLGMLPGVGTAATVVNGGLALTGNRTLGERFVDSFVNGEGGTGTDSGAPREGGGARDQIAKNRPTVPKQSQESFEDRYVKFVDPTPRPTPAEKWQYDTSGYA